ncbi:MAG: hydroxymethylbilane synthase [Syntrophomonadaceae bacterium]|nr:hydroxymethylbilane synthase [Syntrophomonadaceae bacterium]
MQTLKLGTRGSRLALWQAAHVAEVLHRHYTDIDFEIVIIRTTGDKILDTSLSKIGDKGLFTKEIEAALLNGRIDLAVHSMKDVPNELTAGLAIAAILQREAANDVLISRHDLSIKELPEGAVLGTSSLRRISQLRAYRPDLRIKEIRGNVDTRLQRMEEQGLDGVLLAAAGVTRLGLESRISDNIDYSIILPAAGQGAIGVEIRNDDENLRNLLSVIDHEPTAACVRMERVFLAALGGGCQVPIAALAVPQGTDLVLDGLIASLDGNRIYRDQVTVSADAAAEGGARLAHKLLAQGGDAILDEIVRP